MSTIHRHQCMIYEGAAASHLGSLARTLIEKLQANHRCVYLNSPAMIGGMHGTLHGLGFNVAGYIKKGALILSSDRDQLVDGRFDVARMMKMLRHAVKKARTDGYAGLWATGDLTWEFGSESNLDKLQEYEVKLETFIQDTPTLAGICMYHRDTLPPHALQTALATHQSVYMNETSSRTNRKFQFSLFPSFLTRAAGLTG